MSKECEKCFYYGRAADAPETVEEDCMYMPGEDDDGDWTPPCKRTEEVAG